nr:TPA: NADH dehydrogenase subunit 2 [Triannulata magna]
MVKFHYTFMLNPMMNMTMFMLSLSTMLVITSSNWPIMWLMMEFNMMMFIPWLNFKFMNNESEASIKYFLCQALASTLLIFSSIYMSTSSMSYFMLMMALCLKIGSFPCYFWFVSVMKSSNWVSCTMLMTWQKIAPLLIITKFMIQTNKMMFIVSMMNIIVGGMFGMNQTDLRSLLAYSSVAHLGWMFMLLNFSFFMYTWEYFLLYLMIIMPMSMILLMANMKTNNDMFNMNKMNTTLKLLFMLFILSLAGLPPLSGFLLKLIALYPISMISLNTAIMMVLISMMSLYMYLMMIMSSTFMSKHMMNQKSKKLMMKISVMNMLLLPLLIIMYALTLLN